MEINLAQLKGSCECGRTHILTTKRIIIEAGAIDRVLEVSEALDFKSMGCVICDTNTEQYAKIVADKLKPSLYIQKPVVVLNADGLEASDKGAQMAEAEISPYVSWLVAVGSGTVHDITRFLANKMKIPFMSCPTAASTDSYASTVATMTWHDNIKVFTSVAPSAVIADSDIFSQAPYKLTAAGISETFGKYMSLADWQCGKLFLNEQFCDRVHGLVKTSVDRVFQNLPAIRAGMRDASETLMLSLLTSGVAMQMWGDSRPVSGAEHHLAQFWDMRIINEKPTGLCGEKNGVGLLTALRYIEKIKQVTGSARKLSFNTGVSDDVLKNRFGLMASSVMSENQPDPLNAVTPDVIIEKFPAFKQIVASLHGAGKLRPHMQAAGCATTPEDIGLDRGIIPDSLMLAPYVRRRLTMLRVASLIKI